MKSKYQQKICDLFKLINKATTAISRRNYSVFIITFRYISLHLGGVTVYSTC